MDLMWGTWAGHRPPSETSRFTYCLTKAQILFSQWDLSGSISRMFILDRQEYQNVDGLLVFSNTSCFEWRSPNYKSTQSTLKSLRKSSSCQKHSLWDKSVRNLPDMKNNKPSPKTSQLKEDLKASEYGNNHSKRHMLRVVDFSSVIYRNSSSRTENCHHLVSFMLFHARMTLSLCAFWAWRPFNTSYENGNVLLNTVFVKVIGV